MITTQQPRYTDRTGGRVEVRREERERRNSLTRYSYDSMFSMTESSPPMYLLSVLAKRIDLQVI
jgi:hypothetical protein